MKIKNSVALITGGGSGIGEAVAKFMAQRGAKVAIVDMVQENIDRVVSEIIENGGEAIGQIASGMVLSSSVITFAQPDQALNFEIQMQLSLASDDGSLAAQGSVSAAGVETDSGIFVLAVDRNANTITVGTAAGVATGLSTLCPARH